MVYSDFAMSHISHSSSHLPGSSHTQCMIINCISQSKPSLHTIGHTPNIANHVFCHLKNIWWLNFTFFNFIQLAKLSGAYFCCFFGKKYFTSSDPFFVMYNDRCRSFIIRTVGDIKWNSRKTLYITKKGSPKLKYFSKKNYTWRSPDILVSWIEVKKKNFSW